MQIRNAASLKEPVISIILPVYNGGEYLTSSIESVLNQTLKDFEFLILDDCSTDGSWKYISSLDDERVRTYRNEKNKGLFYNINFLIRKIKTNLIKLWAQDDIMYPDCIETFVAFHNKYPQLGFSYSMRDIIDETGAIKKTAISDSTSEIISPEQHARIAFFTGSIAGNISNVCINGRALSEVGLFSENMKISADFDMWVRLAKDHDTGFIRKRLIQLRDHYGQLSRDERFYINHVREDLAVYNNLLNYVSADVKKEGRRLLRKHKFVFYYTLMAKAFLSGKFKAAYQFFKELRSVDNFMVLTFFFIRSKIVSRF